MEPKGHRVADSPRVPTNERMLLIAEVLADARRALTPTEINAQIGLPKQTLHRLCAKMVSLKFLERAADPRRLQPAARLRAMAVGLQAASASDVARRQILEHIAGQVREAVNFVVPQAGGMFYLGRVDTDWALRVQLPVGTQVPFHCTASGKCYLASLTPRQRRSVIQSLRLMRLTPHTLTDVKSLQAEIATAEERGFAIDDEEFMEGLFAIAVPILDKEGRFIAAVAFHGPKVRLNFEVATATLPLLRDSAQRLAALQDLDSI